MLAGVRIHIATDHAGLEFSQTLQAHLRKASHEVLDRDPTSSILRTSEASRSGSTQA
jgi:hypothetical protein